MNIPKRRVLGWIDGAVHKIAPADPTLKIPHMGWNNLVIDHPHPIFDCVETGDHVYFVHSYQMQVEGPEQRIAHVDYAGDVTAVVARDTMIGLQFHPEKKCRARPAYDREFPKLASLGIGCWFAP